MTTKNRGFFRELRTDPNLCVFRDNATCFYFNPIRNLMACKNSNIPIKEVFLKFIEFHNNLKLFHFQTLSFGAHKASDQLFEGFLQKYDLFMEAYQGRYGRLPHLDHTVKIRSLKDEQMPKYCGQFLTFLQQTKQQAQRVKCNSDLVNIIEEMQAIIHQYVYLLTFQ